MPILPPEPFAFPTNLFTVLGTDASDKPDLDPDPVVGIGASGTECAEGEWYVLHTKSRAEKALARWLLAASVRFFLPLYKKKSVLNGRAQTSYPPLFPGYLFLWGDADARYQALASNQVARCLPVHDQDRLSTDLFAVYRLMAGDRPLAPLQQIPSGAPVEVIDGPFAGLIGRMIRVGSQTRLFVEVQMINQGVSVELDRSSVRPLTETENGSAERARIALIRN
jgi:transcription antitermination factor NusG